MTDFAVIGKKGAGKSLYCVGLIRDALKSGRRVATNLDIKLDKLLPPSSRATLIRLPDRPTADDFEALGMGQDGYDEEKNGILILDETSTFFGARQFQDKGRQPMLDWLIHSRKYSWDVYYIMQGLSQVDKLIRETQIEYVVGVKNTNKWPVPFVSSFFGLLGITVRFPKMHVGIMKHGTELHALTIGRKWFKSADVYPAYNTKQIFIERDHPDAVGLHSVLSAYSTRGRYLGWWPMNKPVLYSGALAGAILGIIVGGLLGHQLTKATTTETAQTIKVDETIKPLGIISTSTAISVILPDGKTVPVTGRKQENAVDYYLVSGKWVKM